MPTINTHVTTSWTKLADASDNDLLVTWSIPATLEVASTTANAAPIVEGHRLTNMDAITRSVLGAGYVWAKLVGGSMPADITLIVSK